MKLLMSNDLKQSAVDTEKNTFLIDELKEIAHEVTHTAQTAIENATGKKIDLGDVSSLESSLNAFLKFQEEIKNNAGAVKEFDLDFIRKLARAKPTKLLQKAVYQLEDGEKFDDVYNALKTEKNGALFRALVADKENNRITVYSTRFGIWETMQGILIKMAETNGNLLRINLADRQEKDITKFQDFARQNYPVATDLRNLFKKGLIQELTKDDNYKVTALHFKEEINEEDIKQFESQMGAKKEITKETSHTSKTNANSKEVKKAIEQNEKEIHSTKDDLEIVEVDKYETKRATTVEEFAEKLQRDLEEQQKRERLKLEEKIKQAKNERKKVKEDAIKLLAGGMTIDEAINELKAKKYNDITVKFAEEDLKTEILSSIEKEADLNKTKKELDTTTKKLEVTEEKRQKIYQNYTDELERRKKAESVAVDLTDKLKQALSKIEETQQIVNEQSIKIVDLQDEIAELKDELKARDESIDMLEGENSNLVAQNNAMQINIENQGKKIEELTLLNQTAENKIAELKRINNQIANENIELKEALENYKEMEKELERLKANLNENERLSEEVEQKSEDLDDESFDEIMAKIRGYNSNNMEEE